MYEATEVAGTVKRIVVTSSIVAIQPLSAVFVESDVVYGPDSRTPKIKGPFDNFVAYTASKIAAFNHSEAWVKGHKPKLDVINFHPPFVFGRDETITSTKAFSKGTNALVLAPTLGTPYPGFETAAINSNSLDQTALAHVLALDSAIKGNQSFINSTSGQDGFTWSEINDVVSKHFPEAVKNGIFPNNFTLGSIVAKLDVSKTEENLGYKHAGLEETTVPDFTHYLELLERENAAQKRGR